MEYNFQYNNKNIDINELKKCKKYLDVLYYKICNEERNGSYIYNKNKEYCDEYKNIIYPEIIILYMDIKKNLKLNKEYCNINIEINNKLNILKKYVKIYSYDQKSSL
jgi:hypothetical protein